MYGHVSTSGLPDPVEVADRADVKFDNPLRIPREWRAEAAGTGPAPMKPSEPRALGVARFFAVVPWPRH